MFLTLDYSEVQTMYQQVDGRQLDSERALDYSKVQTMYQQVDGRQLDSERALRNVITRIVHNYRILLGS